MESSRLGLACGGERWLIRLADAGEVINVPSVASVPLTRPWYLGIANIRGNLFTVIDFSAVSWGARQPAAPAAASRLVLFGPRAGELNAGIVVQRVLGLRNIAELAPAAPPHDAPAWYGAALDGRRRQRLAGNRSREACERSRIFAGRHLNVAWETHAGPRREAMALKLGQICSATTGRSPGATDLDMPTTQVKMNQAAQQATTRWPPCPSWISCASRQRADGDAAEAAADRQHLPVVKQFQVLGVLLVTFLVLAAH